MAVASDETVLFGIDFYSNYEYAWELLPRTSHVMSNVCLLCVMPPHEHGHVYAMLLSILFLIFFFARFVDVRVYPITDHSDAPRGPYALSNFYETLKLLHSTRSTILGKCKRWSDGNRKGHCDVSKAMRNSRLLQSRV